DVAALDTVLAERRASGGAGTFVSEVEAWAAGKGERGSRYAIDAARAARAAAGAAEALGPFRTALSGSQQVHALSRFLRAHEARVLEDGEPHDRFRRARAGVLAVLDHLADALARHDNRARGPD